MRRGSNLNSDPRFYSDSLSKSDGKAQKRKGLSKQRSSVSLFSVEVPSEAHDSCVPASGAHQNTQVASVASEKNNVDHDFKATITIPVFSSQFAGLISLGILVLCFIFETLSQVRGSSANLTEVLFLSRSFWAYGYLVCALIAAIPLTAGLFRVIANELCNRMITANTSLGIAVIGVLTDASLRGIFRPEEFVSSSFLTLPLIVISGSAVVRAALLMALKQVRLRSQLSSQESRLARKFVTYGENTVKYLMVDSEDCAEGDVVEVRSGEVVPATGVVLDGAVQIREPRTGRIIRCVRGMVIESGSTIGGSHDRVVLSVLPDDDLSPLSYFRSVSEAGMKVGSPVDASYYWASVTAVSVILCFAVSASVASWWGVFPASVAFLVPLLVPLPFFLHLSMSFRRVSIASLCKRGVVIADEDALERVRDATAIVFDYSLPPKQVLPVVCSVTFLDDRFEEGIVLAMVKLLLQRARDTTTSSVQGILSYLEALPNIQPFSAVIDDFILEKGKGIAATIGQVNVSVGTEEFLISKDVLMAPNDLGILSDQSELLFVAVAGTVVVRFEVKKRVLFEDCNLQNKFASERLSAWMFSSDRQNVLDDWGKRAGFDLAHIMGEQAVASYKESLLRLAPAIFYADYKHQCLDAALVTVSSFSRRLWDATRTDITLFGDETALLIELIKQSRLVHRLKILASVVGGLISALLVLFLAQPTNILLVLLPVAVAVTIVGGTYVLLRSIPL
jgi:cation transport ATPase